MTLETSAYFEICPECGWEDDGQDDSTADEVWGGPNGRLSLAQAREEYAAYIGESNDPDSISQGGEGAWWAAAKRRARDQGVDIPPDLA